MNNRFVKSAYGHFLLWGICTSMAITVCTIVDALLVGNLVGSNGLAVANISTPVFLFYALLGVTVGVGANIHIGRLLGAADVEEANKVFHKQLVFGLSLGGICLLPLVCKEGFLQFLGATGELYPLAEQYLTVVMWSAPLFVMYHILSVSVRTDSDPRLAAIASSAVIVTNLTLDLVFMSVLNWGIIGASASLCIAEGIGVLVLLCHFIKKEVLLKLRLSFPRFSDVKSYITNGFGVGSANIFQAVVMLVFNILLLRFGREMGPLYVAVYGIMYTVSTIPFAIFDGASNALSTVVAFFIGESDTKGVFAVLKRAIISAVLFGSILTVGSMFFAEKVVGFFGLSEPEAIKVAAYTMRIFSISMVFTGINMVITAFWQSVGRARLAGIMSAVRNCLLMLAIGPVLIWKWQLPGLSLTYITVEIICSLLGVSIMFFSSSREYVIKRCGVAGRSFEGNYVIREESLEQIFADLERMCEEWEIGMQQAFFINFICEELLLNIIKFGCKDSKKKYYIDIKLMEKDGDYVLRIRDNVRLYNPFESSGDEIDNGVLLLIKNKAKFYDYQRKMIFNYLYLIL